MPSNDVEQLVAINDISLTVHHHDPVTITVEGDSEICALCNHALRQRLGRCRANSFVDVEPVWRNAHLDDVRTEFAEYGGRDVIGRAMRAIQNDPPLRQPEPMAHGGLAELDVATCGVLNAPSLPEHRGVYCLQRPLELRLDGNLNRIVKLVALRREELDAIVVVRVVGGGDNDSCVAAKRPGQIGYSRCGHGAGKLHIDARRREPRFEGGLEHVPGYARVLADENSADTLAREDPPGRPAQTKHELRRYRLATNAAANAVRTEPAPITHPGSPPELCPFVRLAPPEQHALHQGFHAHHAYARCSHPP